MKITNDTLLDLGFTVMFNRPLWYVYKGVQGKLDPATNTFQFLGFQPVIQRSSDLLFITMLIDYNHPSISTSYRMSDN
ncbi:hypothetical protein [Spirosoma koreense]